MWDGGIGVLRPIIDRHEAQQNTWHKGDNADKRDIEQQIPC